ncbi:Protein of unknown function [Pyronema omphalodes CBS 100304]|uniref:Uncharacterized protein n=1 Tax=Pyronema omphalodes (strain CBS 100304) TaxID=1076935 RepID=U4L8I1_PYROM|nr:Protein of unknown function [Pyronema omphalodes CBS 100304]
MRNLGIALIYNIRAAILILSWKHPLSFDSSSLNRKIINKGVAS